MEYRKVCKVCGRIYCYDDADVKSNKWNAVAGLLGSVATIANAVDGNRYDMYEQSKLADRATSKITDFSKCPYCGSRDIRDLTEEEYRDFQDGLIGNSGASGSNSIQINTNASVDALIQRGMLFLEEGNWKTAQAYFDNALDADPTNSDAYIGKMMIDYRLKTVEDLNRFDQTIDENPNYIKALRFADVEKKKTIVNLGDTIRKNIIFNQNSDKYQQAVELLKRNTVNDIDNAVILFQSLDDFKDSKELLKDCLKAKYQIGKDKINANVSKTISEGISLLEELRDFDGSASLIETGKQRFNQIKREEDEAEERNKTEKAIQQKKKNKNIIVFSVLASLLIGTIALYGLVIAPNNRQKKLIAEYNIASDYYQKQDYLNAYNSFAELGEYSDSKEMAFDSYYLYAVSLFNDGALNECKTILDQIGNYKDSLYYYAMIDYKNAKNNNDLSKCVDLFNNYINKSNNPSQTLIDDASNKKKECLITIAQTEEYIQFFLKNVNDFDMLSSSNLISEVSDHTFTIKSNEGFKYDGYTYTFYSDGTCSQYKVKGRDNWHIEKDNVIVLTDDNGQIDMLLPYIGVTKINESKFIFWNMWNPEIKSAAIVVRD